MIRRWGPVAAGLATLVVMGSVVTIRAATAGDPAAGARVFSQGGCGACHTLAAARATGRVGPNLDQTKPDVARITSMVTSGRGGMPSFRASLSDVQIADVAAYIAQATGSAPPAPAPVGPPVQPSPGTSAPRGAPAAPTTGEAAGPPRIRLRLGAGGVALSVTRAPAGPIRFLITNPGRKARRVEIRKAIESRAAIVDPWLVISSRRAATTIRPRTRRAWNLVLTPGNYAITATRTARDRGAGRVLTITAAPPKEPGAPATPRQPATQAPPSPPPPDPAPTAVNGRLLFTGICGGCHTLAAAGTSGTTGPNLDRKHPDREDVVETVLEGEDEMPSFAGTLSREQIEAIAEFVAASVRR